MFFVLLAVAFVVGLPIAVLVLFARTRRLQQHLEALQAEVAGVRGVREVREVRQVREVREVRQVREALGVPEVREVHEVLGVPEVPEVPEVREVHAATESLETAIGARWLLYIGIVAIVVGASYFEKLAIEYGWIGETARVVQGAVVGLALMYAGTRFTKRGYAVYGQIVAGGGGAILYLSTYAAFNFYALIARSTAFALMVGITILIAWLADRQRSQGLALFAVGGGFLTPFLLPGTEDAQVALFTYVAILIAGTAVLSRRRDWPFLHLASYLFTLVTVAAWADRFYLPVKYLRTEIYLTVYAVMFVYVAHEYRRAASDAGKLVRLLLWTAPAAYYFASLAILANHDTALLVWLVALMLLGGVLSVRVGPAVGLGVWTAVAVPLVVWCATAHAQAMHREGVIALTAVYLIALLAELRTTLLGDDPFSVGTSDVAWIHLNPLVMFAGAYVLLTPVSFLHTGYIAAAFAAWHAALAGGIWRRRAELAVHYLAVSFTLAAIAIALIFNGAAITAGWATEGAVVIFVALRQRTAWLRLAGAALLAVAVAQTIGLLASPPEIGHTVLLNARAGCAALVVALCYALAWRDWRDPEVPLREVSMAAALLIAQFVTLAALTSEIGAYWAFRNGHLQRELMLSVTWGLYATVLVVVGLAREYAPLRYFAMAVLAITIGKVFFIDTAELDRIYRVGSIVMLGILLLVTSYLYNRSRKAIDDRTGRL